MKRVHLSTLLVLTVLMGALLFLNARRTEIPMWSDPPEKGGRIEWVGSGYRWPVPFYEDVYIECDGNAWRLSGIVIDAAVIVSALTLIACASEAATVEKSDFRRVVRDEVC